MRTIGVDVSKISLKAVILGKGNQTIEVFWKAHQGEITQVWQELKEKWRIEAEDKIVFTGRFREMFPFPSIPVRVAGKKLFVFSILEKKSL